MTIQCDKCGEWVDALPIHKCREPSQDDLLPCPICGGVAELVDYGGYEIVCSCGINLCLQGPEKMPLIKRWNTRK